MFSLGALLEHSTRGRPADAARSRSSRSTVAQEAGRDGAGRRITPVTFGGTAAATASGARSPSPRLAARCAASTLPCRVSPPASLLPAAADPSRCLAFDLRLHRPARTTGATTVVGAEVAGVSSAVGGSILAEFVPLSLRSLLPLVLPTAARRRGAAWRRPRRLRRRSSAAATAGRLGRASRASPAALSATRGSPARLACSPRVCKKCRGSLCFFSLCVHACACPTRVSDAPNSPLHEGMRGVA